MDLFRNNQRDFTGSNEDFVDTAPGVPKILSVEYDIVYPDGIVENEYFEKGEHEDPFEIEVPLDAEIEYVPKKTDITKLQRAYYGAGKDQRDVTEKIAGLYRNGRRDFPADNGLFGDPCYGVQKTLSVTYEFNGEI